MLVMWLRDTQISGRLFTLAVSVRMFCEIRPASIHVGITHFCENPNIVKRSRQGRFTLVYLSWHIQLDLPLTLLVLEPSDSN